MPLGIRYDRYAVGVRKVWLSREKAIETKYNMEQLLLDSFHKLNFDLGFFI